MLHTMSAYMPACPPVYLQTVKDGDTVEFVSDAGTGKLTLRVLASEEAAATE